ncbi:MAG: hypothetical protein PF487_13385 [Bacteroidales bacterium]|jgi:hypothetical protein|nr:hypothetical protein [Bacteroidales bacterium]
MKIIEAVKEMKIAIEKVFIDSGLVNGIGAEISSENIPMFWFNFVKSSGGSDKKSYLVWRFQNIINNNGDGKSLAYFFDIDIKFYSNENNALDYLEEINNILDSKGFNMEYVAFDYDNDQQKSYYEFKIRTQVV